MSNDWRNHWRKSRWVTIADFPLLSLDINPATYEGGHADAGCRGNDLLKQAFASDDERIGIKLRMRTQPGNPQQNGYVERYNRTVRYDWLNQYLFESLEEIQDFSTKWLWSYNNERPNMGIGGITPAMKLAQVS